MGQKKNRKLLIIIIILVILLIILGGFTFAFVTTDMFRSNKYLFLKYFSQIADEKIVEYHTKVENNPYQDKGNFSVEITKNGEELESLQYINNFNISYEGKVNIPENKSEQAISLNYSNNVNFPINYRQINNIIGLQTKYVGSKYIAVEEGKEVTSETISIPAINISKNTNNNKNNQENIMKKYINIMQENLQDSNFSKETKDNLTGYKLTLNSEQMKNILIQLLTTLKTDEATLKTINENTDNLVESIDNLINTIENYFDKNNQENIVITVYEQNRELAQINITIPEGVNIDIKKSKNENEIVYQATMKELKENNNEEDQLEMILNLKYTGLQEMNTVQELYELGINIPMESSQTETEQESNNENNTNNNETNENTNTQTTEILSYKYIINNTNTFVDNVEIEEFKDENAIILNTQDQSYVEDLLAKISERLVLVNEKLMQELELTANQNPVLMLNPVNLLIVNSAARTISSSLSELEITAFNEKFTLYENTNQKGATVKGLLTVIENNNSSQDNETKKIKEINFDGQEYDVTEQNITLIKSSINVEDSYKVEFEIDENTGLIYRAVINKK